MKPTKAKQPKAHVVPPLGGSKTVDLCYLHEPAKAGTTNGESPPKALGANLKFQMVPLTALRVAPGQPRKHFDETKLQELADNLKEVGILSPLLVRPLAQSQISNLKSEITEFELVAGERRLRAAALAGLASVPVLVRELTDLQVLEIQGIENLQREDLSALEEAEWMKRLIESGAHSKESLAQKLGIKRSTVYARLRLTTLSKPVREALADGTLDATSAGLLARVPDGEPQKKCLKEALKGDWNSDGPMSFRQLAEHIEEHYMRKLSKATFDRELPILDEALPSCTVCPKRTGNMEGETGDPNVCTDLACWARKTQAHTTAALEAAKAKGLETLSPKEWSAVHYTSKYLELGEKNYADPKGRTYGQCLKEANTKKKIKGLLPTVLAVDDSGELHELARRETFKDLGVKIEHGTSGNHDYQAERATARKAAILENKVANAVAAAVVAKCEARPPDVAFWRLLASAAVESCWNDSIVAISKRRGAADKATHAQQLLQATVPNLSEAQCRGLLLEILCLRGLRGEWHIKEAGAEAFYGIDPKKIAAVVKEEAKNGKPANLKSQISNFKSPKSPKQKGKK